jgi:hypothetical protein
VTCLSPDLFQFLSTTNQTSSLSSSHWKLTCSCYDIAENCWVGVKQHSLTMTIIFLYWFQFLSRPGVIMSKCNSYERLLIRRVWRYQRGYIIIRISKKNKQHNGKKKYKRTNNDLKNIHIKLRSSNTNPTKNRSELAPEG